MFPPIIVTTQGEGAGGVWAPTGAPGRAGVLWSSVVGWGGGVLDSVSKLQRGELQAVAEILEMQLHI